VTREFLRGLAAGLTIGFGGGLATGAALLSLPVPVVRAQQDDFQRSRTCGADIEGCRSIDFVMAAAPSAEPDHPNTRRSQAASSQ
jgi:hypothetical protein